MKSLTVRSLVLRAALCALVLASLTAPGVSAQEIAHTQFFPILARTAGVGGTQWVSDLTVHNLTDTEVVILPWWLKYFVILKSILTMKAQAVIGDAFGINNTMDEFTGRTKKSQ